MGLLVSYAALLLLQALAPPPFTERVAALRDRARPLLIFERSEADPRFSEQARTLALHEDELIDRQVIGFSLPVAGDQIALEARIWRTPTRDEIKANRLRFHVRDDEFVVILIGKDGGEKKRWHRPVRFEELRDTIDAMPMRQDEMKK